MAKENTTRKIAELEALLFEHGEPISIKKISKIIGVGEKKCKELIQEYTDKLSHNERGLTLLQKENEIQLTTKPELEKVIDHLKGEEFKEELTPASLEVLTIIAYLGPISKMDIDYIRGVNSNFTLRSLLVRGLIEREKIDNHYQYKITFKFLRHMGIRRTEDLPEYENYKDLLKKFEIEKTNES